MSDPAPSTPVIVGVGFCQVKSDDPRECPEAYRLMLEAIGDAARDAGAADLPRHFESIAVQKGSWKYPNPGRLLADALGCPDARTILADLGVLQLTPFFNLCREIAEGRQSLGVVTGGEARYRELRSLLTGQAVSDTEQPADTPPPDEFFATPDPFSSELEQQRGIWAPGEFYAIADSAYRHHHGLDVDGHPRARRNVVQHDRKLGGVSDHREVAQHPLLGRPVVVRRHDEQGMRSCLRGQLRALAGMDGVVAARPGDHGGPVAHRLNHRPHDELLLMVSSGR